jgi:hypothetical protein
MTDQRIIPPPELVQDWLIDGECKPSIINYLAIEAAQWGATQELKACCEWFVEEWNDTETAEKLRATRRPKPLSLKEEARQALGRFNANTHGTADQMQNDFELLRRAVEALND